MPRPDEGPQRMPNRSYPWQSFRPWILGGLAWAVISYVVTGEYLAQTGGEYLRELCMLLSLVWWQFAFAGVFQALRHGEHWKLPGLTAMAFLPPAGVCLLVMLTV